MFKMGIWADAETRMCSIDRRTESNQDRRFYFIKMTHHHLQV